MRWPAANGAGLRPLLVWHWMQAVALKRWPARFWIAVIGSLPGSECAPVTKLLWTRRRPSTKRCRFCMPMLLNGCWNIRKPSSE